MVCGAVASRSSKNLLKIRVFYSPEFNLHCKSTPAKTWSLTWLLTAEEITKLPSLWSLKLLGRSVDVVSAQELRKNSSVKLCEIP